jgi:outer membrane protein W
MSWVPALGLAAGLLWTATPAAAESAGAAGPVRRSSRQAPPREPTGFLNIGAGVYEPTDQPGDGFYGVIAGGTEVRKQLDLGVQVSWYHRSTDGAEFTTTFTDPAGNVVEQTIQTDAYDTDLVPVMGIVRYRFPASATVQPYIGGGIGYEWLSVTVEGAVAYDPYGYPYTTTLGTSYGGFGGMAFGGLNFDFKPTTSFYAEATYNWSSPSADYFDPYYLVTITESIDMDGLAIQGGLKFRF